MNCSIWVGVMAKKLILSEVQISNGVDEYELPKSTKRLISLPVVSNISTEWDAVDTK